MHAGDNLPSTLRHHATKDLTTAIGRILMLAFRVQRAEQLPEHRDIIMAKQRKLEYVIHCPIYSQISIHCSFSAVCLCRLLGSTLGSVPLPAAPLLLRQLFNHYFKI